MNVYFSKIHAKEAVLKVLRDKSKSKAAKTAKGSDLSQKVEGA